MAMKSDSETEHSVILALNRFTASIRFQTSLSSPVSGTKF